MESGPQILCTEAWSDWAYASVIYYPGQTAETPLAVLTKEHLILPNLFAYTVLKGCKEIIKITVYPSFPNDSFVPPFFQH